MTVLAAFGAVAAQAGVKVKVCHTPPGHTDNWHTITISEKVLSAHLAHGDLAGNCAANAEALCDDGNVSTIDAMDPESETCLVAHPPVACNDSNLCTNDSCDPVDGCQSAPIVCDDGDLCTVDTCNSVDGQCSGTPIVCGALGECVSETGICVFPCDGISCALPDQCHTAGECVLSGECVDGAPVADGTACDDGDAGTSVDVCMEGDCAGVPAVACPCEGLSVGGTSWTDAYATMSCLTDPVQIYGLSGPGILLEDQEGIKLEAEDRTALNQGVGKICAITDGGAGPFRANLSDAQYQACLDSLTKIADNDDASCQ